MNLYTDYDERQSKGFIVSGAEELSELGRLHVLPEGAVVKAAYHINPIHVLSSFLSFPLLLNLLTRTGVDYKIYTR